MAGGPGGAGGGGVIISIDFVGGTTAAGGAGGAGVVSAPAMSPTETAGAKPAANWNSALGISGTLAALSESDGTATTAGVTWTSPANGANPGEWTVGLADAPGDTRMMNGYLDPTAVASPATVKVTGLPAAITAGYDVYVYTEGSVPSGNTRTYQYAIASTTVTISQTGPSPTTFPGFTLAPAGGTGNYIIFRKVTGTSFTLTATPGTGSQTRAPVNGIQIVWPSGS